MVGGQTINALQDCRSCGVRRLYPCVRRRVSRTPARAANKEHIAGGWSWLLRRSDGLDAFGL